MPPLGNASTQTSAMVLRLGLCDVRLPHSSRCLGSVSCTLHAMPTLVPCGNARVARPVFRAARGRLAFCRLLPYPPPPCSLCLCWGREFRASGPFWVRLPAPSVPPLTRGPGKWKFLRQRQPLGPLGKCGGSVVVREGCVRVLACSTRQPSQLRLVPQSPFRLRLLLILVRVCSQRTPPRQATVCLSG